MRKLLIVLSLVMISSIVMASDPPPRVDISSEELSAKIVVLKSRVNSYADLKSYDAMFLVKEELSQDYLDRRKAEGKKPAGTTASYRLRTGSDGTTSRIQVEALNKEGEITSIVYEKWNTTKAWIFNASQEYGVVGEIAPVDTKFQLDAMIYVGRLQVNPILIASDALQDFDYWAGTDKSGNEIWVAVGTHGWTAVWFDKSNCLPVKVQRGNFETPKYSETVFSDYRKDEAGRWVAYAMLDKYSIGKTVNVQTVKFTKTPDPAFLSTKEPVFPPGTFVTDNTRPDSYGNGYTYTVPAAK